jgi:20S proteasome subunit beta 4
MDTLFGIVGDGFVLLASDTSQVQSIVLQKTDEDKIMVLDEYKLLGTSGETGDR